MSKFREHLREVLRLSGVGLGKRGIQFTVKCGPLLIVEIVSVVRDNAIHELNVDEFALGTIGGLIQNDPPIPDVGSEGLHCSVSLLRGWLFVEGGNGAAALHLLSLLGFYRGQQLGRFDLDRSALALRHLRLPEPGSGVGPLVDLFQRTDRNVGVERGGVQRGVAEHRLDHPHVGAAFEHKGRHRMPEQVARAGLADVRRLHMPPHDVRQVPGREAITKAGHEEHRVVRIDEELLSDFPLVLLDPSESAFADRHHAIVRPLAFVKQATRGDRISARRMREDYWEFEPTHKLQVSTNHRPTIRETVEAIWERVLLIPWTVTIPKEERDPRLAEKLKVEGPGILAKLVRACLAWQREGLPICAAVRVATETYREDMDIFGAFIEMCCVVEQGAVDTADRLFGAFEQWAEENNERDVSQTRFGSQLKDRGFLKARDSKTGRVIWKGIGVREGYATAPAPTIEPGMSIDDLDDAEFDRIIGATERSEQSEPTLGLAAHESDILPLTGNGVQTIQTVQEEFDLEEISELLRSLPSQPNGSEALN